MKELLSHSHEINEQLARYGVKFGIYKDGIFNERLFPFDPIPRQIGQSAFKSLESGLIQRVKALNSFIYDIYHEKRIIRDKVVPKEFVYRSPGYLVQCEGATPPKSVYSHISGIDLVLGKDDEWYILEDNLRIPSGASYPLIARTLCRRCSPETFQKNKVIDNRNYGTLLKRTMDYVNTGGINVIFTPGRYNAAYFEHSYLAEQSGATLAESGDLFVENRVLYYRTDRDPVRVGALYRRVSDEYIDPLFFEPSSLIGIPNLMDAYLAGNIAVINAPGNGVADDKGIYYFVPKMISYYLQEEPLLKNAPTYLPYFESDMSYVISNIDHLVVKDVAEAGGYGVIFGANLAQAQIEELKQAIRNTPRRFIAQEVIDFQDMPLSEGDALVERKADLRAFVLSGEDVIVWPSGLTRFSRNPDSFVVNSSQGGGFKDTWILCQ
ncbi:MAG: circularly permuted type 2 ATP-grasp protein [Schwartzia sp.]|nr:circularly permuted type 2 ATP-grasp protein [Schwartzia sp. (in: firmicutes)]